MSALKPQVLPTEEQSEKARDAFLVLLKLAEEVGLEEMSTPEWIVFLGWPNRDHLDLNSVQ